MIFFLKLDKCKLKFERGFCRALLDVCAFDYDAKKCVWYWYGGCGGNENKYWNEEDCQKACAGCIG
jgi:hypothetical protein